jgi:hypothetical protein
MEGVQMSDHIPDVTKMIGETPRMKAAQMAAMEHMTGDVYRVGCDIERELNAANERIKRLESVENSHAAVLNAIDNWIRQYKAKEAKP